VRGDREGAIADYTAAIELPNAPAPFVAVARLPRGNLRDERCDRTGASADYTAVIELPNAHAEVGVPPPSRARAKTSPALQLQRAAQSTKPG